MTTSQTQSALGKKILITGGTSGVGLETARQLVAVGADVMVVGSGASKGEEAERSLNEAVGTGHATFVAADLSSLAAVRRLAATISERLDRLDVLINNAGVISTKRVETVDGNELTFAVNYLAPFLLTNKLLPLFQQSEAGRILAITAAVEPIGRFPWGDLQRARHYGGLRAYAQSKKALAMYTIELARRLRAEVTGVTANVVDPFLVRTALTSADDVPLLFKLARPLMIQPQTAARWVASAAVDERFAATTGTSCSDVALRVPQGREVNVQPAVYGTRQPPRQNLAAADRATSCLRASKRRGVGALAVRFERLIVRHTASTATNYTYNAQGLQSALGSWGWCRRRREPSCRWRA
jgi:NAD(P)-dependent dehydrogenase (short-subunit alcohol dehydrogenase family)